MRLWLIILPILAQLNTPVFPTIPVPTPWQTPTPQPTAAFVGAAEELLATATLTSDTGLTTDGNQVFYNDDPLLPDTSDANTTTAVSYVKWLVSAGADEVFGPFTPLLVSLSVLLFINLIFVVVWFYKNYIVTLLRAVWWFISLLIRVVRGG